jgi:proteasome lid subunit RPN8/RPN11
MRMLREVKIDKKIIEAFKRRCYKHYPNEYAECLYGTIDAAGEVANVFCSTKVKLEYSSPNECQFYQPDKDLFSDHGWILLGSWHSHPDVYCEPSVHDWETPIFGICSVVKKKKRRFYSFAFFNGKRPLELTIAE